MTGKHIARSLMLAAGMLFAGCGGPDIVDSKDEQSLETREDEIKCDRTFISKTYYFSDATYSKLVGEFGCDCVGALNWGVTSAFSEKHTGTCE